MNTTIVFNGDITWTNATAMPTHTANQIEIDANKTVTKHILSDEEKTYNYMMSGLSVLLLLVIALVAKGLHFWQSRRNSCTVPITKPLENSTEAWSGNVTKSSNTDSLKLPNEPTNGKLPFPKIKLPQHLTTLRITETDDENHSVSGAVSTRVIKETDMDRISNNIDNYLTKIESHLQVPTSARSCRINR